MDDILYEAAQSFYKTTKYNYKYILGNRKRQIILTVLSNRISEFTHIFGIDHLTDTPLVVGKNISQKTTIYNKILNKDIKYDDIKNSTILNKPILDSYKNITQSHYTIYERILVLKDFEKLLDKSFNGQIYKWNKNLCKVIVNKKSRYVTIDADYVLVIQSPRDINEKIYFFLFWINKKSNKNDEPIKLNVFSAFPDCANLIAGQQRPYTILKGYKTNTQTQENKIVYVRPGYSDK